MWVVGANIMTLITSSRMIHPQLLIPLPESPPLWHLCQIECFLGMQSD